MTTGIVIQPPSVFNTGHGLREYRLVIHPDDAVYNKVMAVKQRFTANYGVESAAKAFPCITVAAFYAGEGMEATLIRWIQRICSAQHGFDITLNNYSGFPEHTIYLRVQNRQPFRQLAIQLKAVHDYVRSSGNLPVHCPETPYLSIAADLPEQVYNKAMPVYSKKMFHASFRVHELVLLARDHPMASCKTVTVFRFLPATHPTYSEVA
jgi:hypothetical protein